MSTIAAGTTSGTALVNTGNTDGTIQLQVNGTTPALTLATTGAIGVGSTPAYGSSGQVLTSAGSGAAPTWATVSAGLTLGTPVATTSGTSIDFTNIPSGINQIIINFKQVSTNNSSAFLIQIGDSGGIESSSYSCRTLRLQESSTAEFTSSTNGYINKVNGNSGGACLASGSIFLTRENATQFTWVATGMLFDTSSGECAFTGGDKSLSAVLDRIRITTVSGTASFDSGEINIAYI